jgi:hypothetical protein
MTALSTLTPFRATAPRLKARAPVPAAVREEMNGRNPQSAKNSNPPVERAKHVDIEQLTVNDVHDLSIAAINALVPINPSLVAQLIVEAGRKARSEIPTAPLSSLRPAARAICLAGERARGGELNAEESEFLADFVEQLESTRAS